MVGLQGEPVALLRADETLTSLPNQQVRAINIWENSFKKRDVSQEEIHQSLNSYLATWEELLTLCAQDKADKPPKALGFHTKDGLSQRWSFGSCRIEN